MIGKPLRRLQRSLLKYPPLRPWLYRRSMHAYVIGSAKSGTHSLSGIFERRYRAAHEPEYARLIELIWDAKQGALKSAEIQEELLRRDRQLYLEVESSQLCFFVMAKTGQLADALLYYLERDDEARRIVEQGYTFVSRELPVKNTIVPAHERVARTPDATPRRPEHPS